MKERYPTMQRYAAHATMVAVLAIGLLGPAFAVEYASTDTPLGIYDNTNTHSEITVSSTDTIADLNVKMNITHGYVWDLAIRLTGPGGQECYLFYHQDGGGDNFTNTVFDDEASTDIGSGTPPYTGSFRPYASLGVFDGLSMAGTWLMDVYDQAGPDEGSLDSWSLVFNEEAGDEDSPVVAITSVSPTTIWPPNNKMVPVTVTGTVTDADSGVANAWIEVADEYGELDGTFPVTLDADGNFTLELSLMASRHGSDADGRTYVISLYAVDNEGNEADPDTATVTVPHDQRRAPAPE